MNMNRNYINIILFLLLLSFPSFEMIGQNSDFNVRVLDNPASGYIYLDLQGKGFGLVDNYGNIKFIDSSNSLKNCINWKMLRDGT